MKRTLLTLTVVVIGGTATANAFTLHERELSGVNIYPVIEKFNYKEYKDGKEIDKEDGTLKGVGIEFEGYEKFLGLPIYSSLMFEFLTGDTDYTGAIVDTQTGQETPYSSTTDNKIFRTRFEAGPYFRFNVGRDKEWQVTVIPAFNYGGRRWERDIDVQGRTQDETYGWIYWGGSLDLRIRKSKFYFGAKTYYHKNLGFHKIKVETDTAETTLDLGDIHSWGIELKTGYDFSKRFGVWGAYEYRYTHIDEGEMGDLGGVPVYEPESKTRERVFSVGVALRW